MKALRLFLILAPGLLLVGMVSRAQTIEFKPEAEPFSFAFPRGAEIRHEPSAIVFIGNGCLVADDGIFSLSACQSRRNEFL